MRRQDRRHLVEEAGLELGQRGLRERAHRPVVDEPLLDGEGGLAREGAHGVGLEAEVAGDRLAAPHEGRGQHDELRRVPQERGRHRVTVSGTSSRAAPISTG